MRNEAGRTQRRRRGVEFVEEKKAWVRRQNKSGDLVHPTRYFFGLLVLAQMPSEVTIRRSKESRKKI